MANVHFPFSLQLWGVNHGIFKMAFKSEVPGENIAKDFSNGLRMISYIVIQYTGREGKRG